MYRGLAANGERERKKGKVGFWLVAALLHNVAARISPSLSLVRGGVYVEYRSALLRRQATPLFNPPTPTRFRRPPPGVEDNQEEGGKYLKWFLFGHWGGVCRQHRQLLLLQVFLIFEMRFTVGLCR